MFSKQLEKIVEIIKRHMGVIGHIVTGNSDYSPSLLQKLGINTKTDLISAAYKYGKSKFSSNPQLTPRQQELLQQAQTNSQGFLDNLTTKLIANFTSLFNQGQSQNLRTGEIDLQSLVVNNFNIQSMKSDVNRIIRTESWDAKVQGEVDAILEGNSPFSDNRENTDVYIRPASNACPHCKRLFLENDGITPKVFKLSQLLKNGKNTGKNTDDWLAVLPPIHPHCRCALGIKAEGTRFNEKGDLILKGDSK